MPANTESIVCGHCGHAVGATVVQSSNVRVPAGTHWLLCPLCDSGSVSVRGACWPPATRTGSVQGLPDDVSTAWQEARIAHTVGAYTASEMMCRKILMHVAVDVAGAKPGGTFKSFVEELDKAGYITTGLKATVEVVKDRGNTANHELPASTEADSLRTLQITEYLLRGVYELAAI